MFVPWSEGGLGQFCGVCRKRWAARLGSTQTVEWYLRLVHPRRVLSLTAVCWICRRWCVICRVGGRCCNRRHSIVHVLQSRWIKIFLHFLSTKFWCTLYICTWNGTNFLTREIIWLHDSELGNYCGSQNTIICPSLLSHTYKLPLF